MSQVIRFASAAVETPGGRPLDLSDPAIRTDAVYVVYTSNDATLTAVRVAGSFAKALGVPVTLVHLRAVSYAAPIDAPGGMSPVETGAFIERLRVEGVDLRVRVYLCRDVRRAIPLAFTPHSLIVVAGRRRWWPTASERWRRTLEAAGHFVVFVDASEHGAGGRRGSTGSPRPGLVEGREEPGSPARQPQWGGHNDPSTLRQAQGRPEQRRGANAAARAGGGEARRGVKEERSHA